MRDADEVMLVALASVALAATGCCGECDQREGTYELRYTETSGTCGDIPNQVFTIERQPTEIVAPCTGEIVYSADNCEVTNVDVTCPETGVAADAFSVSNGKYLWDCDAGAGEGTANLRVSDSVGILCQSSYDVFAERL